jgi:hypothetical protein
MKGQDIFTLMITTTHHLLRVIVTVGGEISVSAPYRVLNFYSLLINFSYLSCILIVMSLIFVCRVLSIHYMYLLLLVYFKLRVPNLNFQLLLNTSYIRHITELPDGFRSVEVCSALYYSVLQGSISIS